MIIWVSHAFSWYWYIHATCEVLSWFILETRIPLNYVSLCDCLEPIIDDFIRPECRKRQSNFYIAIRWNSAQWSLACLEYWSLLFFKEQNWRVCDGLEKRKFFLFFLSIALGQWEGRGKEGMSEEGRGKPAFIIIEIIKLWVKREEGIGKFFRSTTHNLNISMIMEAGFLFSSFFVTWPVFC